MSKSREPADPAKKALRKQAIETERQAHIEAILAILRSNGSDHRSNYPCATLHTDGKLYVAVPGSMLSAGYSVAYISVDPDEPPRTWGIIQVEAGSISKSKSIPGS